MRIDADFSDLCRLKVFTGRPIYYVFKDNLFVRRYRKTIIVVFIISDFCEIAKIARYVWLVRLQYSDSTLQELGVLGWLP